MMSLETIQAREREAGVAARAWRLQPRVFLGENRDVFVPHSIPFLGDYEPPGWMLLGNYFVDSSGFGEENEPALTFRGFHARLKSGLGYGVTQAGQFQAYVGVYVRTNMDHCHLAEYWEELLSDPRFQPSEEWRLLAPHAMRALLDRVAEQVLGRQQEEGTV